MSQFPIKFFFICRTLLYMSIFKLLNFSYPQDLRESFTKEGSRKTKGNSQKAMWIVLSYTWFIEKK